MTNEFDTSPGRGPGVASDLAEQAMGAEGLEVLGAARDMAEDVAADAGKAGRRASEIVGDVAHKAAAAYEQAGEVIEPLVRRRPYAALGIAMGIGFILGVLAVGRHPRVIHIHAPEL